LNSYIYVVIMIDR